MPAYPKPTPAPSSTALNRIGRRVEFELNTGCWLWSGTIGRRGYGNVMMGREVHQAHRVFYAAANGAVPSSLPDGRPCIVRHRCDTPSCVNPAHLVIGGHEENMADKVARGRQANGARGGAAHHAARLTAADVMQIRGRHAAGETITSIAADYPVTRKHVEKIIRGSKWQQQGPLAGQQSAGGCA